MEPLKDPVGDRVVASHPPPPARPLSEELLYPDGNKKKPDCDQLRKHCLREGTLTKEMLLDIIERVTEVFKGEPTLVRGSWVAIEVYASFREMHPWVQRDQ